MSEGAVEVAVLTLDIGDDPRGSGSKHRGIAIDTRSAGPREFEEALSHGFLVGLPLSGKASRSLKAVKERPVKCLKLRSNLRGRGAGDCQGLRAGPKRER